MVRPQEGGDEFLEWREILPHHVLEIFLIAPLNQSSKSDNIRLPPGNSPLMLHEVGDLSR